MEETAVKKLTSEELNQIKELQTQYNKSVFELGNIEISLQEILYQKDLIEKEKNNIVSDLKTITNKEKELIDVLQSKYGSGSINPVTGEITSI